MALRDPRTPAATHQHPRNPDPSCSQSWGDATDMIGDNPHEIAKQLLVPAIANRTRNAINVDRREVFFYQRLRSGRRCSCWDGNEGAAHSECQICHATGWAGGFYKWGTHLYLFDPSRQWVGVNIRLNALYGVPPWFTLDDDKTSGYLEWDEILTKSSYFGLDSWRWEYRLGDGAINLQFKLDGIDPGFIPLTEKAISDRLLVANGGRFIFRAYMSRSIGSDDSPKFLQFWFRGLTDSANPPVLMIDIPRRNESNVLAEYGVIESFQPIQMVFSDVIQRINLEDLVVRLHDMTRWKVIEASPNDPLNILTSHDVQARKVFQHEAMWNVPL